MHGKWSAELRNPNVNRFIADHGMHIRDIRVQPFLGADIAWEHTADGWVISLYPRLYHDGPAEESVLHVLSLLARRFRPWFVETPAEEFNRLTQQFLDERRAQNPDDCEEQRWALVAIDGAICSALDLYYLLTRGYLTAPEVRDLASYRSGTFVSDRGAVEFLATMAVLKVAGGNLSELYDTIISNKWYDLLPVLDRIEECVRSGRAVHADSIFVLDKLLPHFKEQGLLDTIAVLRRNVLGPRDASEIDFDVAISYAGEDRELAERIASALVRERVSVFYDRYLEPELWGKDLYQHLTDVYRRRARFCVMVISASYAGKLWPTVEKEAAVARAVDENLDYLLPLRVDDTSVPGLPASLVYIDCRTRSQEEVCQLIVKRARLTK